jgi:TRAP-type C4-dicarboxylate transport system permease small subunit
VRSTARVIHGISRVLLWMSAAALVALLMVTIVNVILRNVTGGSVRGAAELAELALPICAYLAMAYTQAQGGHVASTVVVDRLPERLAARIHGVAMLGATAFLGVLTYLTAKAAWHSWDTAEARFGLLGLPLWPSKTAVAVGLLLLSCEVALQAVQSLTQKAPTGDDDVSARAHHLGETERAGV